MAKKFLYFQPEYVSRFKCDGEKCHAHCCKDWTIVIDSATYKKYSRIKPKDKAKEITSRMKFDSDKNSYIVMLDEKNFCPMLTEDGLCSLQLEYGEDFLSQVCTTYPRITKEFGPFFERTLTMTCPVAAEMILFAQEPMRFEFVEVSQKIHSHNGKIIIEEFTTAIPELFTKLQLVMISILQKRTLTINQRLIVLSFFIDRMEKIYSSGFNEIEDLQKLIAEYESEEFWAEQVPLMLQSVTFDAREFIKFVMTIFEAFYGVGEIQLNQDDRKFIDMVVNALQIKPDADDYISITEITDNYTRLADKREDFFAEYSTFLENYLVNEIFMHCYPRRFQNKTISNNFLVYLISYKVFEMFSFAAWQNNLADKENLLQLVVWYTTQLDHNKHLNERIFEYLEDNDDLFELMDTLLEQ